MLEGDGYTLECNCGKSAGYYGSTLPCVDIRKPAWQERLLAEALEDRLRIAA